MIADTRRSKLSLGASTLSNFQIRGGITNAFITSANSGRIKYNGELFDLGFTHHHYSENYRWIIEEIGENADGYVRER